MELSISRLGFGLSSIAGSGNLSYQQSLVKTALDCGITHFDVAPFYGHGDAEKILGEIISKTSGKITITTKFGLVPFHAGNLGSLLRSTFRPIFRKVHLIKRISSSIINRAHSPKSQTFNSDILLASLDASIQKIGRPVDLFLLHDVDSIIANDSKVIAALHEARNTGRTLRTGISGMFVDIQDPVQRNPKTYSFAQVENSLTTPTHVHELTRFDTNVISHRAIQGGLKQILFLLEQRPGFRKIWNREIEIDSTNYNHIAQILIEVALFENPTGAVLFSTTRIERIKVAAAALYSPLLTPERCLMVRTLFKNVFVDSHRQIGNIPDR